MFYNFKKYLSSSTTSNEELDESEEGAATQQAKTQSPSRANEEKDQANNYCRGTRYPQTTGREIHNPKTFEVNK